MLQASGVCRTFGFVLKSGEQKICFDACCLAKSRRPCVTDRTHVHGSMLARKAVTSFCRLPSSPFMLCVRSWSRVVIISTLALICRLVAEITLPTVPLIGLEATSNFFLFIQSGLRIWSENNDVLC